MTPAKTIERLHNMGLVEYDYTIQGMCKIVKSTLSSEIIAKIDLKKKALIIINESLWKQLMANY